MAYKRYGIVTFDHTKVGSSDAVDFPAYIVLSDNSMKQASGGGQIQNANAYDVGWFSDIGLSIFLPFEIDSYDGTAGVYRVYVKCTISKTTNTSIYFGYNDPSISSTQENIPGTWSNGYTDVWHFRNGTTLDLTNSIPGGATLTAANVSFPPGAVAGLVGLGAAVFSGGSNSHGLTSSHASLSACPVTLEAVINNSTLVNGGGVVSLVGGVDLEVRSTGAVRMNSGAVNATTTAVMVTGTSYYVAGTSSSQDQRSVYLNGANAVSNTTAHISPNSAFSSTNVGQAVNTMTGTLDEARISNVVRGPDYILATNNNLMNNGSFTTSITFGNDVVEGNSGYQTAQTSYTGAPYWNGTNRMLSFAVGIQSNSRTIATMTYGGANCTLIGAVNQGVRRLEHWRIHSSDAGAPAAGNNQLVVTPSGSCDFVVAWVNRQHVSPTTPTEAFSTATGTNTGVANNASLPVVTITDNSTVHVAIVSDDTSIVAGQSGHNNVTGALGSVADEDPGAVTHPAGSTTNTFTGLGTTATWAMAGYSIRPDTAGAQFKSTFNYTNGAISL